MNPVRPAVKSVQNAFTALEFIVEMTLEKDGATLAEIADRLGMRKSTVRNLLQTMELCGYVTRCGFGFYRLGSQFRNLLMVAETSGRLRVLCAPMLRQFCRKFSVSAQLCIFFNGKRHTSLQMNADGVPQENSACADTPENAYRRASTRLLLAYSTPEEKAKFLAGFGRPSASDWAEGSKDLDSALRKIRRDACAVNDSNHISRSVGMAVGIFDQADRLCASLSCSEQESRLVPEKRPRVLAGLRETALRVSDLFARENFLS